LSTYLRTVFFISLLAFLASVAAAASIVVVVVVVVVDYSTRNYYRGIHSLDVGAKVVNFDQTRLEILHVGICADRSDCRRICKSTLIDVDRSRRRVAAAAPRTGSRGGPCRRSTSIDSTRISQARSLARAILYVS